ncbi:hypothetical protein [Hymenobacter sediminicola]|uniref:Lipoprotein n=1 Tax=Hymenobacter sediminicola TaxID=2761579 RepID=A0A7G7WAD8_9BACT|nr:hypothetical protein [Hymenobacter sediminicola]QNH63331.1 hypothetical protein H4317_05875 [Hymenobacter sediminicola]
MSTTLSSFARALSAALSLLCVPACQSDSEAVAEARAARTTPVAKAPAPATQPQPATPIATPDSAALVRQFVPAGYRLLDMKTGDLNRDAYPDKLLVLDSLTADNQGSETRRPLLLLTANAQGQYILAARNDNTVMCSECGGMMGDPYQGLTIKNGYFSVEHYGGSGWRWTHIITFKYNPTDHHWYLHRAGGDSFHASNPDSAKTHIETPRDFGRIRFERYKGNAGWDE